MKSALCLLLSCAALLFVGCETTHTFSVNSLNAPTPLGEFYTFAIAAGPDIDDPDSLEFQEASGFARIALVSEGYEEADSPDQADLLIELNFTLGDPKTQIRERSRPVYGISPILRPRIVKVRGRDGKVHTQVVHTYYPPRHRIIGWDQQISSETLFDKQLSMRAYSIDASDDQQTRKEAWMVEVRNRNASEDLRYYIPRMIAAAIDYIDYNSGSLKKVRIAESDPRIQLIIRPDAL